jgi:hypothetical protein
VAFEWHVTSDGNFPEADLFTLLNAAVRPASGLLRWLLYCPCLHWAKVTIEPGIHFLNHVLSGIENHVALVLRPCTQ